MNTISKALSAEIREAADTMGQEPFIDYLRNLENEGKLTIEYGNHSDCFTYAQDIVNRLKEDLDSGQWFSKGDVNILKAIDEIPGNERTVFEIDGYGFPVKIDNNDQVLYLFGVEAQLAS